MTRLNVKPVASGLYHHSYNPLSVSSIDYGQLVPQLVLETLPRDEWNKIRAVGDMRIAPQIFPPFGRSYLKTASFFVPEYQLIEYSEAFHNNQNLWKGKRTILPFFRSHSITTLLSNYGGSIFSTLVYSTNDPSSDPNLPSLGLFDFVNVYASTLSSPPTFTYHKLNPLGRYYYKVLKGLGYDFPSYRYAATYQDARAAGYYPLNALPLLAYAKIYCDMFMNGQAYNHHPLVQFLHAVHDGETYVDAGGNTCYEASSGLISSYGLLLILDNILVPHNQSLYTEAWNSPNGPLGTSPGVDMVSTPGYNRSLVSPYLVDDYNSAQEHIVANKDATFYSNDAGTVYTMTNFGHNMLLAFDKFVKRFNLFGSKAVQRVYAAFGIRTDNFKSDFVTKIQETSQQVTFHPVMSNAETIYNAQVTKHVGDYSGYGACSLDFSFDYKCRDFGYIITLSWLQVDPIQLRGVSPIVLRNQPYDFYTPEFDGKTVRPIPYCEIGTVRKSNANPNYDNRDIDIYGFTNLYEDYRKIRDVVIGDFVTGSPSNRNFLFCRDFSVLRETTSGQVHPQNSAVQYFDQGDNADMSDPMQYSKSSGDRFWLGLSWEIDANRPVLSEDDSLNFTGSGDVELNKNGVMLN